MRLLSASILLIAGIGPVMAEGPSEKWGHDPATSEWFRNLHSPGGFPCCDYTDGNRLEDPGDYRENEDGSYDVKYAPPDKWVHVPKERIVTIPNKVGAGGDGGVLLYAGSEDVMGNLLGAFFISVTLNGQPMWPGDNRFRFENFADCRTAGMVISGVLPSDSEVTCADEAGHVMARWSR